MSKKVMGFAAMACAGLAFLAGCETKDEANGLVLVVEPASVGLSSTNNAATLVVPAQVERYDETPVRDVELPLRWTVSNPELGNIVSHEGYQAVYARSAGLGVNIVTVRDHSGAEGTVTVSQY